MESRSKNSDSSTNCFSFADELTVETMPVSETIVTVDPTMNFRYLGTALAKDIQRRDRDLYDSMADQIIEDPIINPNPEESVTDIVKLFEDYAEGCLLIRLECITDEGCRNWRKAKNLLLTDTIQTAVSAIGKYMSSETGKLLVPRLKPGRNRKYDIGKMLRTAFYLKAASVTGINMHERAFPTSQYSTSDVMLCALKKRSEASEYQVFCVSKLVHSSNALVAYLLGLESSIPDWYCVPYGYESRMKELIWRYL